MANDVDAASFNRLINVVAKNGILAKHLGQLLDRSQQEKFASVLFEISRRADTSLACCRELLDLEFARKVGEEATILRENSLCTRFITLYTLSTAKNFLKRLLTSFMMEADQEAPDEVWYRERVDALFRGLAQDDMLGFMPRPIRAVTAIISEMAERYCPDRRYPLMAGYLFLRLINPCLASPMTYGLLPRETVLPPAARSNLLVISKVLQHLSNNSRYAQYPLLETWINEMQPEMENFLDRVIDDDTGGDPPFSDQMIEEPEDIDASDLDASVLTELHSLMTCHKAALVAVRSRLEKSGNSALVELYNELLSALGEASLSDHSSSLADDDEDGGADVSPRLTKSPSPSPRERDRSSRHVRNKSLDNSSARKNVVGNMRDKALKLMNFGAKPGSTRNSTQANGVLSPNSSGTIPSLRDNIVQLLNKDDVSLSSNVGVFMLLREMMSKRKGVQCSRPGLFVAKDAVTWVEDLIEDRGNALVVMRMMEELHLIATMDPSAEATAKFQDDTSVYGVETERFRIWDSLLAIGRSQADGDPSAVSLTLIPILDQLVSVLNPRGLSDEQNLKRQEDLRQLGVVMQGFLLSSAETPNRIEMQAAQEWLVMYGQMSHKLAIELLHSLLRDGIIISAALPDMRDVLPEDAALVLNCIAAAFYNQRGRHVKPWDRWSIVHLLLDKVPATKDTQPAIKSEYGLPEMLLDQFCELDDFHPSVKAFRGRGKSKSVEHWLNVWKRLEEAELVCLKQVIRYDAAAQTMSEPHFWFVSTAGTDFLLQHIAHVPSVFSFHSAQSPLGARNVSDSSRAIPQSRFFNITRRVGSGKQNRRSGEFEPESGADMPVDERKSPRGKILARNRKPVSPGRGTDVQLAKRSGDYKAMAEESGLHTNAPEFQRVESAPVLSARPQRGTVSPRQPTFLSRNRTDSNEERMRSPVLRNASTRSSRTHSGSSTEIPSVTGRTKSNSNAGM